MSLIFSIFNSLVLEGGAAIPESTPIEKKNIRKFVKKAIADVVEPVFSKYNLPTDFILVGSTGQKDFSNDIDIAIEVPKEKHVYPLLNKLAEYAESKGIKHYKSLANNIISIAATINDITAQVDIILYSKNKSTVVKNIMRSDTSKSKYKNVHRILLLKAISKVISKTPPNKDGIYSQYSFLNLKGLYRSTYKTIGQKGQPLKNPAKISSELITDNWKKILNILLGESAKQRDVESVESLWNFIHSPLFIHKNKLPEIIEKYKDILEKNNIPYPKFGE